MKMFNMLNNFKHYPKIVHFHFNYFSLDIFSVNMRSRSQEESALEEHFVPRLCEKTITLQAALRVGIVLQIQEE